MKFARTLALATTLALPACGGEGNAPSTGEPTSPATDTTPSPSPGIGTPAAQPGSAEDRAPAASARTSASTSSDDAGAADAAVSDAGRVSGPLPPPELPASLA